MEHREAPRDLLLHKPIMRRFTDEELLLIIQDAGDVNITNQNGDTPLHLALKRESIAVALELIKRGADINAKGKRGLTPLHRAVHYCNMEAVCLLLYYNVDVTIVCSDNKVAFMDATDPDRLEIAYLLLNYHDDFPISSFYNDSALHIFARNVSPIAIDLFHKGVSVNTVNTTGSSAITQSISYDSPDLFKLLWPKIDNSILFQTGLPFLITYLEQCKFNKDDWVQCLYMVFECDQAFKLVKHCISLIRLQDEITFFKILVTSLNKNNIDLCHKEKVIFIVLSLGAEVYFSDIDWLVGMDYFEEVLLLAYFSTKDPYFKPNRHVLTEFFTLTCRPRSYTRQYLSVQFMLQITNCRNCNCLMTSVERALGYFSHPHAFKEQLLLMVRYSNKGECDTRRINRLPEITPLEERCRNRIRNTIQENNNITKPYQFYDVIKRLPLPTYEQNVLSFKKELYN